MWENKRVCQHLDNLFRKSPFMKVFLLNRGENIETNGVIAHYEQFFFWPQCFQMMSIAEASKGVCMRERAKVWI